MEKWTTLRSIAEDTYSFFSFYYHHATGLSFYTHWNIRKPDVHHEFQKPGVDTSTINQAHTPEKKYVIEYFLG